MDVNSASGWHGRPLFNSSHLKPCTHTFHKTQTRLFPIICNRLWQTILRRIACYQDVARRMYVWVTYVLARYWSEHGVRYIWCRPLLRCSYETIRLGETRDHVVDGESMYLFREYVPCDSCSHRALSSQGRQSSARVEFAVATLSRRN